MIDPYVFCEEISNHLKEDDVIVSSCGAACVVPIQALRLKQGQRHIVNSGCATMGYGLPAAIGACFAHGQKRVICFEGDGSIQLNIQELQTIVHYQLPIKVFVFNNKGYLSIRTTQKNYFDSRFVGEGAKSGVSFPNILMVSAAYKITVFGIFYHKEMSEVIDLVLDTDGPVVCDVMMDPNISMRKTEFPIILTKEGV